MVKLQKKMDSKTNKNMETKNTSIEVTDQQQQQQKQGNTKTKEKRRNNEKRKEKSRDAARCRRSKETEIFTELGDVLPLRREEVDQLDKASIMRLSISYLKIRGMIDLFQDINSDLYEIDESKENNTFEFPKEIEKQKLVLQALDGFVLVLSVDGDVTYVSENINEFLGISQVDLLGQPIWEYSHQCDHDELREALNGRRASPLELQSGKNKNDVKPIVHRDFFIRLKCTLTSRGRSVNIKSASYKVIHVSGHILSNSEGEKQLISVCRPLPHPSNIDVPMGSSTFLTKHSLDMKFSYVDDKMFALLGYHPEHLIGKSLYECHHGGDSDSLLSTFKSLISKGQTETCRYRFLARTGGYSWIVTQATLVYDKQKPQSVVCVNYVISGIENENEIYSCSQLEAYEDNRKRFGVKEEKEVIAAKEKIIIESAEDIILTGKEIPLSTISIKPNICGLITSKPRSVTAEIFASSEIPPIVLTPPSAVSSTATTTTTIQQPKRISVTSKLVTPIAFIAPTIRPQPVTSKLFVPRTEEMNKGFLMFSEEEPGLTMLKDEPDDLTHLAPTAGDACIPLDEATPYFTDMFDDLILPDSYCTLLPDDINSLDSHSSKANSTDPFINYRDESSDTSGTPNILSPGLSKSPAGSSLPSLCSPNGSLPEEDLSFMGMSMDDELDLSMRAPYIPMTEADDLPLLLSDDLMWGAFPEGLSLHKDIKPSSLIQTNEIINLKQEKSVDSSLAALLCGDGGNIAQSQEQQTSIQQQVLQQQLNQQQQIQSQQIQIQNNNNNNSNNNNINNIQNQHNNNNVQDENRKINTIEQQQNGGNLVNPHDVLGQVFNKNCANLDQTWTMTDLLQINSSNLLKNSNNNNINNNSNTTNHNNNMNNNNNNNNTNTSNVSILTSPILIQTNPQLNKKQDRIINNHKRPSNITSIELNNTKRIKSSQINSETQSSPQLLQQLMAPTPSPHRSRSKCDKLDGKWNIDTGGQKSLINLQHQASNSVLMNLLVSGCDVSAGYVCFVPMRPKKTAKA